MEDSADCGGGGGSEREGPLWGLTDGGGKGHMIKC